jgi:type IV pilus assembly protein PilC
MPLFKYTALAADGKTVSGVMEADNAVRLQQQLKENGQYAKSIVPAGAGSAVLNKSASLKDLSIFARQFHAMMRSGVSVVKCLDLLYQQANNKKLKEVIFRVYESVQRGDLLSESMKKQEGVFPELMIAMIDTGEASGTLDQILGKLADNFEKDLKVRRKIQTAMIYPIILTILMVVVVIGLVTFILPMFSEMFESSGTALPGPTRMLIGLSEFIRGYWFLIAFVVIAIVIAFKAWSNNEKGRFQWDRLKLQLPVIKNSLSMIYSSRLTRTLATLVNSGLPLLSALDIAGRVIGNSYVGKAMQHTKDDVRSGASLSQALRKAAIFPVMVHSMIGIGEESGTLDSMLETTADYFDNESEKAMSQMVALMEPALIIVMAAVVGFIVISIILPIFDMSKTVQ